MNDRPSQEPLGAPRARSMPPFAVVAELAVLYELTALGVAESEEQLGREAAEKVSRLFGARFFSILKGPLLNQRPIVLWGARDEAELRYHLTRPGPNQFRFSFPLEEGGDVVTIFVEQARPIDEREARLYTILARRLQAAMLLLKERADRERALEVVRQSEARFQALISSMGDALILTDTAGRILLANPATESLLRIPPTSLQGKQVLTELMFVSEESEDSPCKIIEDVLTGDVEKKSVEIVFLVRPDHEKVPVSLVVSKVRDAHGEFSGVVLLLRDETAAYKAQQALREVCSETQMYLEIADVILLVLDSHGCVKLINRKGLEILGRSREEVVGKNWFDNFLPESVRDEIRAKFGKMIAGNLEDTAYAENPIVRSDGTERLIEWHNTVIRDAQGRIVGTLSSGLDVTDVRAAQAKAERQLEELKRWYSVTLGREEFVLRLKKEINELCEKLGEPPRYEITA